MLAYGEAESEYHWPVCIYHARGKALVPLAEVLNRHATRHATWRDFSYP